jgi:hypothetical protein
MNCDTGLPDCSEIWLDEVHKMFQLEERYFLETSNGCAAPKEFFGATQIGLIN